MIPGGTPNPPLRRVVDAPFTSKSHFGLLAVRCLSYMGWGSPLFFFLVYSTRSQIWTHYCSGDPYPVGTVSGKLQFLLVIDSENSSGPRFWVGI